MKRSSSWRRTWRWEVRIERGDLPHVRHDPGVVRTTPWPPRTGSPHQPTIPNTRSDVAFPGRCRVAPATASRGSGAAVQVSALAGPGCVVQYPSRWQALEGPPFGERRWCRLVRRRRSGVQPYRGRRGAYPPKRWARVDPGGLPVFDGPGVASALARAGLSATANTPGVRGLSLLHPRSGSFLRHLAHAL